jgi:hypothetical protein
MIFRVCLMINDHVEEIREFFHADEAKGFAKVGRIMADMFVGTGQFIVTTRACDPNNIQF